MTAKPLRPYQSKLVLEVRQAWEAGAQNVLMRADTGAGKTLMLSHLVREHVGGAAIIAHRDNLVAQLSEALAALGIRHNIIASQKTIAQIVRRNTKKFGQSFYDPTNIVAVASVDTLRKATGLEWWFPQVTFWIVDEGHHVVEDNKWHTVLQKFTNPAVRGLLPTATPDRADGKGLGRGHGGVADAMVEGPLMRWLIEEGYLTDYRMVCIESAIVAALAGEKTSANGDFSAATIKKAMEATEGKIVGDMVRLYREWAPGKRGVVFVSDVDTATKTAKKFREAGFKFEVIIGDMDPNLRDQFLQQLEQGTLDGVVAVDVISEGFDLPAIVCGIFGRKTESLAMYMQQFGRVLRAIYAEGYDLTTRAGRLAAIAAGPKPKAIIIDCVNNFLRHGPPDKARPWSLEGRRRGPSDAIPDTSCGNSEVGIGWTATTPEEIARAMAGSAEWLRTVNPDGTVWMDGCAQPYERFRPHCPHCGFKKTVEASARAAPEMVDGDMFELSPEVLAMMRGQADAAVMPQADYLAHQLSTGIDPTFAHANARRHGERVAALGSLKDSMALWGGVQRERGLTDAEMQRLFFLTFKTDVLSAQALKRAEAEAFKKRVDEAVMAEA